MNPSSSPATGHYDRYLSPAELAATQSYAWNDRTPEMDHLHFAMVCIQTHGLHYSTEARALQVWTDSFPAGDEKESA